MTSLLHVLLCEDEETDAILIRRELAKQWPDVVLHVVDDRDQMETALSDERWDIILSDQAMPRFSASAALACAQSRVPDTPFIVVSGAIRFEDAVSLMKEGARDFVQKDDLARLTPTVAREIDQAAVRRAAGIAEERYLASEKSFQSVVEKIPDAVFVLDSARVVQFVNGEAERMFERTGEELVGSPFGLDTVLGETIEVNVARRDGETVIAELCTTAARWRGEDSHIVCPRDVTAYKQAEEKLAAAKVQADFANQAKSAFLASMSHELRTPLNAVLGYAHMLQFDQKSPLTAIQVEYAENIHAAGEHLLEVINDILDLVRVESNRLSFYIEEVCANDIIADCVDWAALLRGQKRVKIVNKFRAYAPIILRTDPTRCKQILVNLLSNAIKYNREGGTVTIHGNDSGDGFQRISVSDTGACIAADEQANVFEMYHRAGEDTMVAREGTGIGLAVTKLLVENLGGQIGFAREEGTGSTFWIDLPLASNTDVVIWTDEMSVGIEAIDRDHRALASLLNKAARSSANAGGNDTAFDELIGYSRRHFEREETIMEACGYAELETHRTDHRRLLTEAETIAENPDQDGRSQRRLRQWLRRHIAHANRELAACGEGKAGVIDQALKRFDREGRRL